MDPMGRARVVYDIVKLEEFGRPCKRRDKAGCTGQDVFREAFWAAAPKGTKSCRTQWDFVCSFVRPFIRLFIRSFVRLSVCSFV